MRSSKQIHDKHGKKLFRLRLDPPEDTYYGKALPWWLRSDGGRFVELYNGSHRPTYVFENDYMFNTGRFVEIGCYIPVYNKQGINMVIEI